MPVPAGGAGRQTIRMMKITKVYTKTGDGGATSLVGGIRISKADIRLAAYGTIDELNSQLGLLAAYMAREAGPAGATRAAEDGREDYPARDIGVIERVQCCLFNVGTHLATDRSRTPLYDSAKLPDGEVERMEREIDALTDCFPEPSGFILPGGTVAAAEAHVCRTVCRRAEREIVALAAEAEVAPEICRYVNRLSDYLFVLAKKINFMAGKSEKMWTTPCD